MRRHLLKVHLYLGLLLGGAFALLGLTGSFLVFYPEIDRGLNPELVNPSVMHSPPSVQAWFDHLHAQFPQRKGPWRIEIPRSTDQVVFARYLKPEETDPNVFAPMVVALDPDSGAVLNARMWGDYLVTWVYDLHYSLLMGKLGTVLVSLLGMALLDLGLIARGQSTEAKLKLHASLVALFLVVAHVAMIFGMLDPSLLQAGTAMPAHGPIVH